MKQEIKQIRELLNRIESLENDTAEKSFKESFELPETDT